MLSVYVVVTDNSVTRFTHKHPTEIDCWKITCQHFFDRKPLWTGFSPISDPISAARIILSITFYQWNNRYEFNNLIAVTIVITTRISWDQEIQNPGVKKLRWLKQSVSNPEILTLCTPSLRHTLRISGLNHHASLSVNRRVGLGWTIEYKNKNERMVHSKTNDFPTKFVGESFG